MTRVCAFGALALTIFGCHKKATPAECDALVTRYAELVAREAMPDASAEDVRATQTRAREEAADDEDFRACAGRVTHEELACAMAASTADTFEACLQ
ncbi:MAG: hypothetical protein ACRELY_20960 [Polyangiaceae bacterium]